RRTEERGRQLAFEYLLPIERIAGGLEQLDLFAHFRRRRTVHRAAPKARVEELQDPLELPSLAERPGDGTGADAEDFLHLVEVVERLAPQPIELVHEGEDGDSAAAADLAQLAGLRLDPFGAVYQHPRRVGGRQ